VINVNSKVKLNMNVIRQFDKATVTALEQTTDALLTEVKNAQVMPFDTGNLQNESTFVDYSHSAQGKTTISSSTPYARRLYYHPEFNFQKTNNKNAGGKWFDPWLKGGSRENFCNEAFEKIYRRLTGL
jgi:molybdenum cofactor biosynthesis enzyme MoaA